ncbi:YcaO-like family protein [Pseudomonas sichuanensis]|uniref:YcaO-like family protein n=1 Tax=Pseudomonas TaxID=286 RepID=UPI0036E530BD
MLSERELSEHEAQLRLEQLCKSLGLHPKIENLGDDDLVASCVLHDATGNELSSGAGKGRNCKLGALAECLEHHLSATPTPLSICSEVIVESAKNLDDWLLLSLPPCSIPAFESEAADSDARLYVPAALLAPEARIARQTGDTPAAFINKYSSNSGTALGCTENEALLHAINEVIERHALSIYYLSLCNLTTPLKLFQPAPSLIKQAFSNHSELEDHSKDLKIYMSDTFYDTYFCIAIPSSSLPNELSVIGSGCSTDPSTALYRAVTEQIQCERLRSSKELLEDEDTSVTLSKSKKLAALLHPLPNANYPSLHPSVKSYSVRQQIKRTLLNLKEYDRQVFYHVLFDEPGLASVVQVYIPGLERFHLIRSGIPVAPQSALSNGAREPHVHL